MPHDNDVRLKWPLLNDAGQSSNHHCFDPFSQQGIHKGIQDFAEYEMTYGWKRAQNLQFDSKTMIFTTIYQIIVSDNKRISFSDTYKTTLLCQA